MAKTEKSKSTEKRGSYHHGDLRSALINAGERVLASTGVEGFSLRQVAREVGVSHSAPAHHFGDTAGLLGAMAADGFRRFLAAMVKRQEGAPKDPREKIIASAFGYLDFAQASPALFRLMFRSDLNKKPTPELQQAAELAFEHLASDIKRIRNKSPYDDPQAMKDVMAAWSMVHGFADLMISGRMIPVQEMAEEERETFFRNVFARCVV